MLCAEYSEFKTTEDFEKYLQTVEVEFTNGEDFHVKDNGEVKLFKWYSGTRRIKPNIFQYAGTGVPSYKADLTSSQAYGEDIHNSLIKEEKFQDKFGNFNL